MPRLFIAVDVSPEVKDALRSAQAQFDAARLPVRWTKPDLMHLTLVFLGETDQRDVARIELRLRESVTTIHAHELRLARLGVFPTSSRPKVIWCGLDGATGELERLQGAIEAAVADVVPQHGARPFTPHLTIGRVRPDAIPAERRLVGIVIERAPTLPRVSWRVDQAALYMSIPAAGGVQHVRLLSAPLGTASTSA